MITTESRTENAANEELASPGTVPEVAAMQGFVQNIQGIIGQQDAARSETHALRAETLYAALYTAALKDIGYNSSVLFYSVCTGCGATWAGKGPNTCPVCGRLNATFRRVN